MSALVLVPPGAAAGAVPATPSSPSAVQKRAQHPQFVPTWSRAALAPQLPLVFPVDPTLPPSSKPRYRSRYQPPDPSALPAPARWGELSDFELALYLIDFSPLERTLATMYAPSRKGQVPFHPVSLLLSVCLRRELQLTWPTLARLLAGEHGAAWRAHFGFTAGCTPSASGLRYFFQTVGPAVVEGLCPQVIALLRAYRLCPERSTYPGDPPERGVTICQDGMLHPARQRRGCHWATDACFQPRPAPADAVPDAAGADPAGATAAGARPCRAREHQQPGCTCASAACQAQCVRASRLDPTARLIHYAGRGAKPAASPAGDAAGAPGPAPRPAAGTTVFGYRDVTERLLDDRFAVAWTLRSGLYPANTDERTVFRPRVQALRATFPDLPIGEWLDDAGVAYADCLDAIWELGALRMGDLRADASDQDAAACRQRGYDGQGRPLCPHGYRLRANGYDTARRRAKYVCAQACRREALAEGEPIQPVGGCPYLAPAAAGGYTFNWGRAFPDGSNRLARDLPYGSPAWQARYGRRNLAESRNGQLEGLGLKRMPSYSEAHATKEVQVGDFVINLRTLGRLVREASAGPPS